MRAAHLQGVSQALRQRIDFTASCRDSDPIPKVPDAGAVVDRHGVAVQMMHDGTLVRADAYCGSWMTELIRRLRGHHEPQEELLFHALVRRAEPGSLMVELGAWWAYYTNWWLAAVPGATAVCVEPDPENLEVGRANLALNGRRAECINALLGGSHLPRVDFPCATRGGTVAVECLDMPALAARLQGRAVEMLHMDMQGAELPFLRSLRRNASPVRFVMVSTHHESISGSATTHEDCLAELRAQGAVILAEHDIAESFSGDGLIVASFDPRDAEVPLPSISRNRTGIPDWLAPAGTVSPRTTAVRWARRTLAGVARACGLLLP